MIPAAEALMRIRTVPSITCSKLRKAAWRWTARLSTAYTMKADTVQQSTSELQETVQVHQSIPNVQLLKPDKPAEIKCARISPDAFYFEQAAGHKIMTKVPAVIRRIPISLFMVNCSWSMRKAKRTVRTMLSLSTGTTLEASPI